eukprot:3480122-Amphidinium_carterae.1
MFLLKPSNKQKQKVKPSIRTFINSTLNKPHSSCLSCLAKSDLKANPFFVVPSSWQRTGFKLTLHKFCVLLCKALLLEEYLGVVREVRPNGMKHVGDTLGSQSTPKRKSTRNQSLPSEGRLKTNHLTNSYNIKCFTTNCAPYEPTCLPNTFWKGTSKRICSCPEQSWFEWGKDIDKTGRSCGTRLATLVRAVSFHP